MALSALSSSGIQSDYLKLLSTTSSAINYEAPILALTSLNQNPRTFGSTDYVAALENFYSQNQIGDSTLLNDDFFGILALVSAGVPSTNKIITDSKNFILSHQNSDGGWSWSTSGSSDSNDTAAAIMALVAAGTGPADPHIQNALNYLKTTQEPDGGFVYDTSGNTTDSSSTSWVVWALNALSIDPSTWAQNSNNPLTYLASYQTNSGYFKWEASDTAPSSPAVTADAVIALADKTLPLNITNINTAGSSSTASSGGFGGGSSQTPTNPQTPATFPFRIEGSAQTVCEGSASGPTALDIVKNAGLICGFTYHIATSSLGDYLDQINNDQASGNTGWMYFVNDISPNVGAGSYTLTPNDEVLWYYGGWGWQPTRLSLSATVVPAKGSVTATVQYFTASSTWQALSGADVYFGTQTVQTDSSGQATVSPPDGYYKIYAQEDGYVRSNGETLTVGSGQQNSAAVSLNADIESNGGQVQGTSTSASNDIIAFTVSPSALDFGSLAAGKAASKTLNFFNTGTVPVKIQAQTTGDSLFTDNLLLDNADWHSFNLSLPQGAGQNTTASLAVPANYNLSGQKTGQIVFWATEN